MLRTALLLGLIFLAAGCKSDGTSAVPSNPFSSSTASPAPVRQVNYTAAAPEVSMRVDAIGREIVAKNAAIGMRPLYATVSDPKPEIFHHELQGTKTIYITSGLVDMCKTKEQLAAVLSTELGKMVSEREARTNAKTREGAGLPPPETMVGLGNGYSGASDMTHMAEMARYEKRYPRRPPPPPDPRYLAQNYLEKAGYARAELDAAIPILDAAEKNFTWESQITGRAKQRNWSPGG